MKLQSLSPKERVLKIAENHINEKGVWDVSISEVIKEAHVSKKAFYRLFYNKQSMLVYLCAKRMKRMTNCLEELSKRVDNKVERVIALAIFSIICNESDGSKVPLYFFASNKALWKNCLPESEKELEQAFCSLNYAYTKCINDILPFAKSEEELQKAWKHVGRYMRGTIAINNNAITGDLNLCMQSIHDEIDSLITLLQPAIKETIKIDNKLMVVNCRSIIDQYNIDYRNSVCF
ncbi:TetR/AcrR family transcriptional regulator [Ferrimonas pelagia]|uniref:HTH tetR-type domain-containing protein n=1 Tax=Ferrimonas pelagia TaxID=1177826 RepID=A0ABP9ELR6_9GAMM